jgi:hypothetical protein
MQGPLNLKLAVRIVHTGHVRIAAMQNTLSTIRHHQSKMLDKGQVVAGA